MIKKRLFYDNVAFTADTDDITIIQPRYIEEVHVSLLVQQNGGTAPTLEDILSIINKAQVKLTGKIVTELAGRDLLAYSVLVGNRSVKFLVPSSDNEYGLVEGLVMPMKLAAGAHTLSLRFLHTSVATIDNEKISFATLESDEPLAAEHIEIPKFAFTPPSTGAYNTALDATFAGTLQGFLFYSTTIPTTSATTTSLAKLRLKAGGDIVFEDNWHGLAAQTYYPEDSTLRSVLDNYVYVDLSKAPIPAGTRVEVEVYSDDTNPIEILPIVSVPTA